MTNTVSLVALVVLVSGAIVLPQQAPPAGSPALYKSGAELVAALKEGAGGAQTAAVSNTDKYRINIVRRLRGAAPLAHAGNTEVHHIIDGSATVVTGGTVVRSSSGAAIEGGVSRHVTKGDVILVPADTPQVQGRRRFDYVSRSAIRRAGKVARRRPRTAAVGHQEIGCYFPAAFHSSAFVCGFSEVCTLM